MNLNILSLAGTRIAQIRALPTWSLHEISSFVGPAPTGVKFRFLLGARELWEDVGLSELGVKDGDDITLVKISRQLVLGGLWEGTAELWDMDLGVHLMSFEDHQRPVVHVAFSHAGDRIATSSEDLTVKLWDVASGNCLRTLVGHRTGVKIAVWSPNDTEVLTSSNRSVAAELPSYAKLFDAKTGACKSEVMAEDRAQVIEVTFRNDCALAVSSLDNNAALSVCVENGCKVEFNGHEDRVHGARISSSGAILLTSSYDCTAKAWDAASGRCTTTYRGSGHSKTGNTRLLESIEIHPGGFQALPGSLEASRAVFDRFEQA